MALEETIRKMIKEELEAQLGEQISSVNSRIDAMEEEMRKKLRILMKLRKYTLDQLMLEHRKVKSELFPKSEGLNENAEI